LTPLHNSQARPRARISTVPARTGQRKMATVLGARMPPPCLGGPLPMLSAWATRLMLPMHTHRHTHIHTRARAHTNTHTHTYTYTYTYTIYKQVGCCLARQHLNLRRTRARRRVVQRGYTCHVSYIYIVKRDLLVSK